MKLQWRFSFLSVLFLAPSAYAQQPIPQGTILAVRLNHTLSTKNAKPNGIISARVMQDVPLPGGGKIHEGAKVTGHVVDVRQPQGASASISFVLDRVLTSKKGLRVTTDLRALASLLAVDDAFVPDYGMGEGDTWSARTTIQVGGDAVYWGGGSVIGASGPVGKPVEGADSGVLVQVSANPERHCRGEINDNHGPQALWVFSSDACGVYGIDGLSIAHAGRTEPIGVIELVSNRGEVRVRIGSGLLLRVIAPAD